MRNLGSLAVPLVPSTPAVVTARRADAQRPGAKPVGSYATRFQLDEAPISEGGRWINGGKDGLDWFDVITKNGVAYGAAAGARSGGPRRPGSARGGGVSVPSAGPDPRSSGWAREGVIAGARK